MQKEQRDPIFFGDPRASPVRFAHEEQGVHRQCPSEYSDSTNFASVPSSIQSSSLSDRTATVGFLRCPPNAQAEQPAEPDCSSLLFGGSLPLPLAPAESLVRGHHGEESPVSRHAAEAVDSTILKAKPRARHQILLRA